jgi:hypothetical protein
MWYMPRPNDRLNPLAAVLADQGISIVPDVYSVNELAELNYAMTPLFKAREAEPRSYVRPDDMLSLGILELVLSSAMKDLILSIIPDPVLYHLHANEIAGSNSQSHIFGDRLDGWHRDSDSAFFKGDPTHVSIFVYLSDVGPSDGPFEFCPRQPDEGLSPGSPVATMTGPPGFSFVWQRGFYHRAAPNRGKQRRRVLKISVQRNAFRSDHLSMDFFSHAISAMANRDPLSDLMFGVYQGKPAPSLKPATTIKPETVTAGGSLDLPENMWAMLVAKEKSATGKPVAYG